MCWQDKVARETITQLRDEFQITTAIETGTYKGVGAEWLARNFPYVYTIEKEEEYLEIAVARLSRLGIKNCITVQAESPAYLEWLNKPNISEPYFFYLDAHFYDPKRKERWVVVDELKALKGLGDCVIAIHDFDNGQFGHLCYDGQNLDWSVVGEHLMQINPCFHYYTNTECDIYTPETVKGVTVDEVVIDNLEHWKGKDRRGFLYAVPKALDLSKYKLRSIF